MLEVMQKWLSLFLPGRYVMNTVIWWQRARGTVQLEVQHVPSSKKNKKLKTGQD